MRTNMKKLAACILALLLVVQMVPAMADTYTSGEYQTGDSTYREKLEISTETSIIVIGEEIHIERTAGYNDLKWSSSDESVATVDQDGNVKAVGEGTVRITASEAGENGQSYTDSITLKVIPDPYTQNENEEGTSETETESEGESETETETQRSIIIVINAGKDKYTYDGEEHESGFTPKSNSEFDADLVHIKDGKRVVGKDCGVYTVHYEAKDFTYDDPNTKVEFVVSDGWMQIKPKQITVKANDVEKVAGEPDPELTVTIDGLVDEKDGDQIILTSITRDQGEAPGQYPIFVEGEELQLNYRVKYSAGYLTIASKGISGTYLLGLSKYNALVTATAMTGISDKRLVAVTYNESEGGYIETKGATDYWKFEALSNGKYYITNNGSYMNLGNAKQLTLSSTPQELTVNVLSNGKVEIKNDQGFRLNLKSNNVSLGFQGYNSGKAVDANESFTLYRGVIAAGNGNSILSFNANGGSDKAPKQIFVKTGKTVVLPNMTGTKNGSEFLGWAEVSNITSAVPGTNHTYHDIYRAGSKYTVKNDSVTLYAVWNNINKKVQFGIRKDGQIQEEPNGYPTSLYIGHFTVEDAVKEGYWIIDNATNKPINDYYVSNNITANLKHIPTAEEIKEALLKEGNVVFDPETQYVHWYVLKYAKGGWHVDGVIRDKETKSIGYHSSVAESERIGVEQMPAGYSVNPGSEVTVGSNLNGQVMIPTRTGYTFLGWNTKENGKGKLYASGDKITLDEDIDLYAQWEVTKRKVVIRSDWPEGKMGYVGARITLTAEITGFDGLLEGTHYKYQWQHSTDLETWIDEEGANAKTYTYVLDETTTHYSWRVVVIDLK